MSNNNEWYDDDDDFDTEDNDQDGGVRNLRKADRAKSKRIKELEAELEGLRNFQRQSVVSSVLNERGVNPKIATFIPQDVATDAEAIGKWLEEYGELFGAAPQQQAVSQQEEAVDRNRAVLRQIDAVANSSIAPDSINDAYTRLMNAESAEEIISMINGF